MKNPFEFLGGFVFTMAMALWVGFAIQAGIMIFAVFYGWWGVAGWTAVNVAAAYGFNKARKTVRAEGMDDKMSSSRMTTSLADVVENFRKHRESESHE